MKNGFFMHSKSHRRFLYDPDPHRDPLVRGTDPRIRIRIRHPYQNVTDPEHWCLAFLWVLVLKGPPGSGSRFVRLVWSGSRVVRLVWSGSRLTRRCCYAAEHMHELLLSNGGQVAESAAAATTTHLVIDENNVDLLPPDLEVGQPLKLKIEKKQQIISNAADPSGFWFRSDPLFFPLHREFYDFSCVTFK